MGEATATAVSVAEGQAELVERARAGDREARGALYDLLARDVQRCVCALNGRLPHSEVEDAVQETFLRLFAALERYDGSRPLRPFALGIARRVTLELGRRGRALPADEGEELAQAPSGDTPAPERAERVEEQPLGELCEKIGQSAGRAILVDPGVEEVVSCRLRQLPWRMALEIVAEQARCELEERAGGVLLLTQAPRATIQASDCRAGDFYQLLASYAGKNVVVSGDLSAQISADLKEVPFLRAMTAVAWSQGHEVVSETEDLIRLRPAPWAKEWPAAPLRPATAPERSGRDRQLEQLLAEVAQLVRAGDAQAAQAKLREAVALFSKPESAAPQRPAVPKPKSPEVVASQAAIEAIIAEIEGLAEQGDVEGLIERFSQLRDLMRRYAEVEPESADRQATLAKLNRRLERFKEIQLSIQLQVYINEVNVQLRNMAAAIKQERYGEALASHARLKQIVSEMKAEQGEVFHRNAAAAEQRGAALAQRARVLARIAKLPLEVEALVVFPAGAEAQSAAVVNGSTVRVGDAPLVEDEEVPGLKVLAIQRSTVRFRLDDTEFVRDLRSPR